MAARPLSAAGHRNQRGTAPSNVELAQACILTSVSGFRLLTAAAGPLSAQAKCMFGFYVFPLRGER